ncbi:MAG: TIGR00269 family protein [Candidatus Woesearchaeota archaeon]
MECKKCQNKAVFLEPNLCREHFISYIENKFVKTIKKHNLLDKKKKIVIACSGGKDSLSLLYLCNKYFNVEALAIDEGISGYRENTLKDLVNFCKKNSIKYRIVSYKDEFGFTLDEMLKILNTKPCSICGVLRRYLLNKHSKDYDVIATGHNMDDEVQSIMMNLFSGNIELLSRLGPKSGVEESKFFVQKVKPFYFLTEKEIMTYAFLMKFDVSFNECPNAPSSFRAKVRDEINKLKEERKVKQQIVKNFIKMLPELKEKIKMQNIEIKKCLRCGKASHNDVCEACNIVEKLNAPLIQVKV